MSRRILNFYAGPTSLPITVLEQIQSELFDYRGTGMSVMEISHRAKEIVGLLADTTERIKRLLLLDDQFEVLLLQGGGSLQFHMIPANFSASGDAVDYIDTGYWALKSIHEAEKLDRDLAVIASSADRKYSYLPTGWQVRPNAKYLHLITNNTVEGTQWHQMPRVDIPLIADMSSDLLTRPFDPNDYDMVYAHAQKNIGIAGVTLLIIRKSLIETIPADLPVVLNYRTHIQASSNYHTPPVFSIYVTNLILKWIEDEVGGLANLGAINQQKSSLLYDYIDSTPFYQCNVEPASRSWMNVVFTLPTPELTKEFVEKAHQSGFVGLGGHRSLGGCRASLFNGVTLEAVKALIEFMHSFEREHNAVPSLSN